MDIRVLDILEDQKRSRVTVIIQIDGKSKRWNMSCGLWDFVYQLINERTRKEPQ